MTKLEILNKNISKAAQSKLGITYNQKIKKVALESMQEYADQQLILSGVVSTSKCEHEPRYYDTKYTSCKKCNKVLQMKP